MRRVHQFDSADAVWEKYMLSTIDHAKGAATEFRRYAIIADSFADVAVSASHAVFTSKNFPRFKVYEKEECKV